MGCGGSKDKPGAEDAAKEKPVKADDTKAAAPVDKPVQEQPKEEPKSTERQAHEGEHGFMSEDLKALMSDYFNRYDLDGSQSINSCEELKQLCTNLVVKLDLDKDVADIDKIVMDAGPFEDDPDLKGKSKDQCNNWKLEEFQKWFIAPGHFDVKGDWSKHDQSDEDEDATAERPFLNGTYVGTIEGGDKKYTRKIRKGGRINPATSQLEDWKDELSHEFIFKITRDKDDENKLIERPGCDSVGMHVTKGTIEGDTIKITIDYDIDGNSETKEARLVLEGKWCGLDQNQGNDIAGTWKNIEEDSAAQESLKLIGLEGVNEGTFKFSKRIREDE